MHISKETIDEIRNSASITQVIGHYIPLIKKGRGYTAVCPFHDDHDPSLSISEEKQIFKCFVCGKGGNVFSFVMDYKKCSFEEAVVEVSNIIGKPLNITFEKKKRVSKYEHLYEIMSEAKVFCNYLLSSNGGKDALNYLTNRGLDTDIIERFQIGYVPNDNILYRYLKGKGYKDEDLIRVNLARLGQYGMQDVFYNRIVFPIHDEYGNCVAYTARTLSNNQSKYINTSQTEIYTKGDVLYNLDKAKESIISAQRVIVCEGVMDVLAFERSGIKYAVATLGTACSPKQLQLLSKYSKHLLLAYDGDEAGQNAILKLGVEAYKHNLTVTVIDNKTGLDPDEIVNKYKEKALRDVASHEIHFIDFAINYYRSRYNLNNYSDRKEMTEKVGELIGLLNDEYDRINFEKTLFDITKMNVVKTNNVKKWYNKKKVFEPYYSIDGLTKAEYTILAEMAISKRAVQIYRKELGCMLSDINEALAIMIIEMYRKYDECNFSRLYDETTDDRIKNLIEDLSVNESLPKVYSEEILLGSIEKVKLEIKMKKLEQLKARMKEVELVDPSKAQELLREYSEITKELGGIYGKKAR